MSPVLVNPSRFGAAAPPATWVSTATALTPTAWWRFGESSGTTAADSSGNSHAGTYNTAVTLGVTGLVTGDSDTAVSLPGSTAGRVDIAYGSWMDASTALSMLVLVKTSSAGTVTILDRDNGSSRVWQLRFNSGKLEFVKIGGTGGVVTADSVSAYNDGVTHDFGVTYDASNIRLYVDGTKVATVAAAGNLGTGTSPLTVGYRIAGGTTALTGVVDELIYKAGTVWADSDFAALHAAR